MKLIDKKNRINVQERNNFLQINIGTLQSVLNILQLNYATNIEKWHQLHQRHVQNLSSEENIDWSVRLVPDHLEIFT